MGGGGGLLGSVLNPLIGSGQADDSQFSSGQMANYARGAANRNQETVGAVLPQQREFGQQLAQQALGNGTPITTATMNAATDRQLQQQLGAMQSNRSVNPALAQQQFMQSAAQQHQATAQQSGIQALQERQANQGMFQNYLNSVNGAEQAAIGGGVQASNSFGQAQQAQQGRQDQITGALIGAGGQAATAMAGKAHGGMIENPPAYGPRSIIGQNFHRMKSGGVVGGSAPMPGDSPQNDTVPTMLSPGEVVIPRSIMSGKNPAEAAAKFVRAVLAKKGNR